MPAITLPAHYDGRQIVLDETYALPPNARLLVMVLPEKDAEERDAWLHFSALQLNRAYGPDEPEYTLDDLKERNPDYEGN